MASVRQISVFLENRPGTLAELARVFEQNNIDMRALSLAEAADFGIARLIVDDAYAAAQVLKEAGYVCSMTKVLAVEMEDRPGALGRVLTVLGDAGLNLEYTYAFLTPKKDCAYMILRVADSDEAKRVLAAAGIRTLDPEQMQLLFT